MSCNECTRYRQALAQARDLIDAALDHGQSRGKPVFESELGRLVAATASAKGITLAAVSLESGYTSDYTARICRGKLALNERAAKLIGDVLGLDLVGYVVPMTRAPRKAKVAQAAPALPGIDAGQVEAA
jgi:hypothetical protein